MKSATLSALLIAASATASASVLYDNLSSVTSNPGGGGTFASTPSYRFQIYQGASGSASLESIEIATFIGFNNSGHSTAGHSYSLTAFNASGAEIGTYSLSSVGSAYSANASFLWYRNFTFDLTGLSVPGNSYVLLRFNTDDGAPALLSAPYYYSSPSTVSISAGVNNFTSYFGSVLKLTGAATSGGGGGAPVPEPSTYGLVLGGLALAGAVVARRRKQAK